MFALRGFILPQHRSLSIVPDIRFRLNRRITEAGYPSRAKALFLFLFGSRSHFPPTRRGYGPSALLVGGSVFVKEARRRGYDRRPASRSQSLRSPAWGGRGPD